MDYEKLYKEALEAAREGKSIEQIFPELQEIKDEKIRKGILKLFRAWQWETIDYGKLKRQDAIDWLIKQEHVEQDTEIRDLWVYIREWNDKFGRLPKDEDELASCINYVIKRQKPSEWSEEDERMRLETIKAFQLAYPYATEEENPRKRNIDWLKSLKPQPRWKPSEEEIKLLKLYLNMKLLSI